jgi:hypothetical protein
MTLTFSNLWPRSIDLKHYKWKKNIYEAQFLTNQMSNVETGKKKESIT